MLECTDLATALFLLLASHYVFNLSYHTKTHEFLTFIQESVANIPSEKSRKGKREKSPVSVAHVTGIKRVYETFI